MDYVVLDAPDSLEADWRVYGDTLVIWINRDLDSVTKQRYIQKACREHGIEPRRRRTTPVFLPAFPAGKLREAAVKHPALAAGAGLVTAAGVAAAMVLPAAINDNALERRPPAAAAPPTSHPGNPGTAQPPKRGHAKHHHRPRVSTHGAAPDGIASRRTTGGIALPIADKVTDVAVPPVTTPPVEVPTSPRLPAPAGRVLTVNLPPVLKTTVKLSPQPQVQIRLGAERP